MLEGGWDLDKIDPNERLVLPGQTCVNTLKQMSEFSWLAERWTSQTISTTFWDNGRVNLFFGNCNNLGEVTVLVDGTEIKKSSGKNTKATFNVEHGTNLTIQADDKAIIRLKGIKIECGNNFV